MESATPGRHTVETTRGADMPARTDSRLESAVVSDYQKGEGAVILSHRHGVAPRTILAILKRHDVRSRPRWQPTHAVNVDYFETIDTEEKAYWLGFVAADGCVTSNGKNGFRFHLGLAARDTEHMEKFRAAVGCTGPLRLSSRPSPRSGKPTFRCAIQIGRTEFCKHLIRHGIVPRKSWSLVPPTANVPADLLRHYWRGHFDGDGWFTAPSDSAKRRAWQMGVVGTRGIADGFAAFLTAGCGVRVSVHLDKRTGSTWDAMVRGVHQVKAAAALLYGGATVSLDRKRALAGRQAPEVPKLPPFRPNAPLTRGGETLSLHQWAKRLGLNATTVYYRLKHGATPEEALRPVGV